MRLKFKKAHRPEGIITSALLKANTFCKLKFETIRFSESKFFEKKFWYFLRIMNINFFFGILRLSINKHLSTISKLENNNPNYLLEVQHLPEVSYFA